MVTPDFLNRLKTMRHDLANLLEKPSAMTLAEPLRTRLSALATTLAECEHQAAQMYKDQENRRTRVTALASELVTLMEAPKPVATPTIATERTQDPAPWPAQTTSDKSTVMQPVAAAPSSISQLSTGAGQTVSEDVSLISRSTVSPKCEAFVFEIRDMTGSTQEVRLETYRLGDKVFVKTRNPVAATEASWKKGEDSYGAFFLCYRDEVASIEDKRLRAAASFALS